MAEDRVETQLNLASLIPLTGFERTVIAPYRAFSDEAIRSISKDLHEAGRLAWSRIPRIYVILHTINQVDAIDSFIKDGLSDLSLPFTWENLPSAVKDSSVRLKFLEAQKLVLNKSLDLERNATHCHFRNEDDVPLEKIAELGQGGFGFVDRVRSTVSHQEYARKLLLRGRNFKKDKRVLKEFENELGILKKLSHRHVVRFMGSYTDPRFVGILMLPIANCNMEEYLAGSPEISLLGTFFGCLAAALSFLHQNTIRHKDIKPRNILVHKASVILTDFGLSRDWEDHSTSTGPTAQTPRYAAPEVAIHAPRNTSSDIWSLGCVFLEMWTTLVGRSVASLRAYLQKNGTKSSCYHLNMSAVDLWCRSLQPADFAMKGPEHWIQNMLINRQEFRWTAQMLCDRIQEESESNRLPYVGLCCNSTIGSPESVSVSGNDSDIDCLAPLELTSQPLFPLSHSSDDQAYLSQPTPSFLASVARKSKRRRSSADEDHSALRYRSSPDNTTLPLSHGGTRSESKRARLLRGGIHASTTQSSMNASMPVVAPLSAAYVASASSPLFGFHSQGATDHTDRPNSQRPSSFSLSNDDRATSIPMQMNNAPNVGQIASPHGSSKRRNGENDTAGNHDHTIKPQPHIDPHRSNGDGNLLPPEVWSDLMSSLDVESMSSPYVARNSIKGATFDAPNPPPLPSKGIVERQLEAMRAYTNEGSAEKANEIFEDLLSTIKQSMPSMALHNAMSIVFQGQVRQIHEIEQGFEQLCTSRKNQHGLRNGLTVGAYVAYAEVLHEMLPGELDKDEPDMIVVERQIKRFKTLLDELFNAYFTPVLSQVFLWRTLEDQRDETGTEPIKGGEEGENAVSHLNEDIIRGCLKEPLLLDAVQLAREYDELCKTCIVEKTIAWAVDAGFAVTAKDENGNKGVRLAPWLRPADPPTVNGSFNLDIVDLPGHEKLRKFMDTERRKQGK